MKINRYSLTRKPYIVLSVITLLVLFSISFISSYPSKIVMLYKAIISIYIVVSMVTFIEIFLRQLIYNTFVIPSQLWKKEVDRPKLACFLLSLFFIYLSYISMQKLTAEGIGKVLFWILIVSNLLSLIFGVFILWFIWSSKFENAFIPRIKEQIEKTYPIASVIDPTHGINIQDFLVKNRWLSGDPTTIESFLTYRGNNVELNDLEIQNSKKLEWVLEKGLNNNQKFNSQTLITLISEVYDTEKTDAIKTVVEKFFKTDYHISSKNLSTWKKNDSEYLREIKEELQSLFVNLSKY